MITFKFGMDKIVIHNYFSNAPSKWKNNFTDKEILHDNQIERHKQHQNLPSGSAFSDDTCFSVKYRIKQNLSIFIICLYGVR